MAYMLLTLAAMFWGGNYVIGRVLVESADPIIMTEARWALTAILLSLIYFKKVAANFAKIKASIGSILTFSILGQVMFPATLYIGLQYTSSLNAAIYMSVCPCMVILINRVIFKDEVSKSNYLGIFLSTLGVIYLILKGEITNLESFQHLNQGDAWTMLSSASWALYCSLMRKKDKTIDGNAFVTICSIIGSIILIPITLLHLHGGAKIDPTPYYNPNFMLGIAYLVIFPSWLSYVFWNKGITEIGATRGGIYNHIIPLSGGLFSIIFLHTPIETFHFISAIFIVTGIWLCSKK